MLTDRRQDVPTPVLPSVSVAEGSSRALSANAAPPAASRDLVAFGGGVVSGASEPAANSPQQLPTNKPKQVLDPGLRRLSGALGRVLRRVPYTDRDLRYDVEATGIVAYLESLNRGEPEATAIKSGLRAADCARRPAGTRSQVVKFVSDDLPAVRREAELASAFVPPEWSAGGVLATLPPNERRVAHLCITLGATQAEAAEVLEVSRHKVREWIARARELAAAEMVRMGVRPHALRLSMSRVGSRS